MFTFALRLLTSMYEFIPFVLRVVRLIADICIGSIALAKKFLVSASGSDRSIGQGVALQLLVDFQTVRILVPPKVQIS